MKHLFLLGLLSACSTAPASRPPVASRADHEHALISATLRRTLNNPASYQPVSFAVDGVWTRADSASLLALNAGESVPAYTRADSARVAGQRYQHQFRATNAFGALVLSDKTVVVYPNDSVVVMAF